MLCFLNTFHVCKYLSSRNEFVIGKYGMKPISRVRDILHHVVSYIDTCLAIGYTSHVEGWKISKKLVWLLDRLYPQHITGRQALKRVEVEHL